MGMPKHSIIWRQEDELSGRGFISCCRRAIGSPLLYAAAENPALVLANILVGASSGVLVVIAYPCRYYHHTSNIDRVDGGTHGSDVEIFCLRGTIRYWRNSFWLGHQVCWLFVNLCGFRGAILCVGHIDTSIIPWQVRANTGRNGCKLDYIGCSSRYCRNYTLWLGGGRKGTRPTAENVAFQFDVRKGLPLCILAGILSACYSFALDQGQPIADVAEKYGAGGFQGNIIYLFSNTGAFLVTSVYCIYLHGKFRTFGEYRAFVGTTTLARGKLARNYLLACLTGTMWYMQFFFYGLGHVRMGSFKFSSWAIHMIMLVLISLITGLLMKEWAGTRRRTLVALYTALLILIASVLLLTYGNYLGSN